MSLILPALRYELDDLEPVLSKRTVDLHYNKHTAGYFDVANQLIKGTIFEHSSLVDIIQNKEFLYQDTKLFNNVAQAWNHSFYWNCLTPDTAQKINNELLDQIDIDFGSFAKFKTEFSRKASEMFGAGWCWLISDNGQLRIITTPNAITPLTDKTKEPLLTIDVWEHAYLYDEQYAANRKQYVENIWSIINWEFVYMNFLTSKI